MTRHAWKSAIAAAAVLVVSCAEPVGPRSPIAPPDGPSLALRGATPMAMLLGTTVYANSVVSFSQGGSIGIPIFADRKDPTQALGAPNSGGAGDPVKFVSLGLGGQIILKFAEPVKGEIAVVQEVTYTDPDYPNEQAEVWVSIDNVTYTKVGVATNNRSDPLHDTHVSKFTLPAGCWLYVKLIDVSVVSEQVYAADGFDLDAVAIENAVPCPAAGCSTGYYKTHDVPGDELAFTDYGVNSPLTLEEALDNSAGGPTLQDAKNQLLHQGAAALLNSQLVLGFPMHTATIAGMINDGLASSSRSYVLGIKSQLDALNNLGCSLGNTYPHE